MPGLISGELVEVFRAGAPAGYVSTTFIEVFSQNALSYGRVSTNFAEAFLVPRPDSVVSVAPAIATNAFSNVVVPVVVTGVFTLGADYVAKLVLGLTTINLSASAAVQSLDGATLAFTVPPFGTPGSYTLVVSKLFETVPIALSLQLPFEIVGQVAFVSPTPVWDPVGNLAPMGSWSANSGVLPDAASRAWSRVGAGGVLGANGVTITAASAHGYRSIGTQHSSDRMELQATFAGTSSNPLWASGVSGHVMQIDDGERILGVSIGDVLTVIEPVSGRVVFELPSAAQPGGWLSRRGYHLVKDGTTWWDFYVDGERVLRLPYAAAPTTAYGVTLLEWGWADETPGATGVGTWDRVDRSVGFALAPHWKVDRQRANIPAPLQEAWTSRHEAFLRGIVGLSHATGDRMDRISDAFTAGSMAVAEGAFDGSQLPSVAGWTETGGTWSVVRSRVHVTPGATPAYAAYAFDAPENTDAVFYAAATFVVRDHAADVYGRVGPFVQVLNGHRAIAVAIIEDPENREGMVTILTDSVTAALTSPGRLHPVGARDRETRLELYVVGRSRVILFVNGEIVDDRDYATFTVATSVYAARIGRDGSATLSCDLDLSDAVAWVGYSDPGARPAFLRRIAERLLFSGGNEGNSRLDAWMRHRPGVVRARGTDRALVEIARIAGDDDAEFVTSRLPAAWFLGVTYPGITPTFLVSGTIGIVRDRVVEVHPTAPNFTWARLSKLIRTYLLPRNVIEDRARIALASFLTSSITTGGGESEFDVESAAGFAAGDSVTLRQTIAGDLLTVEYDGAPSTAADAMVAGVVHGVAGARWSAAVAGTSTVSIGSKAFAGKVPDVLLNISAGAVVRVRGASADVDTVAFLYGVSGGVGVTERLHVSGTTWVYGVVPWDVSGLLGVRIAAPQSANVEFENATSLAALFLIAAGLTGSGIHEVALLTRADVLRVVADAVMTLPVVVVGAEAGGTARIERILLNGTTPVDTTGSFVSFHVIALGRIPSVNIITVSDGLVDPASVGIRVVSTSASDTQQISVVLLDTTGTARLVQLTLNGTTPVTLALDYDVWRFAGAILSRVAVGTVTVRNHDGTITYASIAPAALQTGINRRRVECLDEIDVVCNQNPVTPRYVVVLGEDEAGELAVEAVRVSTTPARTNRSWSMYLGVATGDVPSSATVSTSGLAWRHRTWEAVVFGLASSFAWTAEGPAGGVLAFDGALDNAASSAADAGPVAFQGTWSETEDVEVVDVVGTAITTTEVLGSFTTGATLRQREE